MPNISSPLGTTQPYIPAITTSQLGRYAGLHLHFPTLAALNAAVTDERANILASSALWSDNQPMTVASESARGISRVWNALLQHAKTVIVSSSLVITLANDTNTVLEVVGFPNNSIGANGDVALDWSANSYYTKSAGVWSLTGQLNQVVQANGTNLSIAPTPTAITVFSDTGSDVILPVSDGVSAGLILPSEKIKLAGIASNATVNSPDSALRDRSTHTGTQPSTTISDFVEAAQDAAAAAITSGINNGVNIVYDDLNNRINASVTAATNLSAIFTPTTISINSDTGTDITLVATDSTNAGLFLPAEKVKLNGIASGATVNSTDAALRDRSTHTGTQLSTTISDFVEAAQDAAAAAITSGVNSGISLIYDDINNRINASVSAATNLSAVVTPTTIAINSDTGTDITLGAADVTNAGLFLPAEKTKLAGIASNATVNSTDAALRDRSTHTGTQLSTTISDFTASSTAVADSRFSSLLATVYTAPGAKITTAAAMGALVVDVTKALNVKSINTDVTLTFSAVPAANTEYSVRLINTDAVNSRLITLPVIFNDVTQKSAAEIVAIPPSGTVTLRFVYDGTKTILYTTSALIKTFQMSFWIPSITDGLLVNIPVEVPLNILKMTAQASSGSFTLTGSIDGVNLGGTPNSVTTVKSSQAHATFNNAPANSSLVLTASSNASALGVGITIVCTNQL